ncbi:MAG TPA: TetR/AcrR family transcriptional regulator [Caulobacteraceae bacterium]|nr:TetR/AcrR family transcriptional regulator [Caulobacteraceae bacterium]
MTEGDFADLPDDAGAEGDGARRRILEAAFKEFMEHGYADTSTLAIATRAKVSKRSLYALVGNKQQILAECIRKRAVRFVPDAPLPRAKDRAGLAAALADFGAHLLGELTDPKVIAVYRLAIAESARAPEVAKAVEDAGDLFARRAMRKIFQHARDDGLVGGDPAAMADQFHALLMGNLLVGLAMRTADRPDAAALRRRAETAADAVLHLNPA